MPLTDKQRAKLQALAEEWGEDAAALVAEVEGAAPGDPVAAGPNGGKGFYANQYPFLRVNEVRKSLGLADAPDGEQFTSQWLEKYGPKTPTGGAPATEPENNE